MRHAKIHAPNKPFPCPHCDKGYVDANSLRKHMRNHECEVCGAELADAADVARHRALHIEVEKARRAFQVR
jgi:transcription elongation factor Elf1